MTDIDALIKNIDDILVLNERNVLVPHGVPGLARECLKNAATALASQRDEIARLREALESIEEYWNQDQNETAMADACWYAVHTAHAALGRDA